MLDSNAQQGEVVMLGSEKRFGAGVYVEKDYLGRFPVQFGNGATRRCTLGNVISSAFKEG